MRLQMGDGLEWLARGGNYQQLGFSSLGAFALERLERPAGWVGEARSMGRRLAERPEMRQALMEGRISWSAAIELVKLSTPANEDGPDEADVLAVGESMTVRQLREWRRRGEAPAAESPEPDVRVLQVAMDRVDFWALEGCRKLVRPGRAADWEVVEAMLGEGLVALLHAEPDLQLAPEGALSEEANAWLADKARWAREAEEACEQRVAEIRRPVPVVIEEIDWSDLSPVETDARLRKLAAELANRDLEIGRLARAFLGADAHFKLGYASREQYVRERLGVSYASLKARMTLARRCHALPEVAVALSQGQIGAEAAGMLARVGRPGTVGDWIDRAQRRTVKHLREDVGLAQLLAEGRQPGLPPAAEETKAWQEIERTLRAGKLFDSPPEPSTASSTAPSAEPSPGPSQMSGGPGPGRVTVRLRLDDELVGFWRRMEDMHRRSRQGGAFAEWLIGVFLRTWATVKPKSVKYGEIYERDRGQCANPCCTRTDVTPHHIVFRSAGGGEEESNLISLCVVCHLDLLHGGKLEVTGPAGEARFVMGRDRVVVVEGRERAA